MMAESGNLLPDSLAESTAARCHGQGISRGSGAKMLSPQRELWESAS
jgi:hypothetical protein